MSETGAVVPAAAVAAAPAEALPIEAPPAPPELPRPHCQNCDAPLDGPYCAACGQRHDPHLHSLGHFIAEAAENLTHADSRLWRTLWALVAKPGLLTREFLVGRRARYLPPFRLYLVVTLLFFVLVALLPGNDVPFEVRGEADGEPAIVVGTPQDGGKAPCTDLRYEGPGEDWIQPALIRGCRSAALDGGRALKQSFLHNVPRALFLFMPLVAAFAMLLYWRPRRYYVEHLLFYIHNHAALFALFGLFTLLTLPIAETAFAEWLGIALFFYLVWYLYAAMRRVFGQSRRRTIAKFLVIGFAYLVLGGITLVITALYSAVTL